MASETQELASVIRLAMDRSNGKIRTAIPGRVTAFDPQTQRASCVPAVQSFYFDVDLDEPVAYQPPVITNCPVVFPAGGGYSIRFPLAAGDDCLIIVAERSIDEWAGTGNASNIPRDLRRFDLSDAIVIPGLRPQARPLANFDADSLEILNENGSVLRINANGTVYLGNAGADAVTELENTVAELVTILTALLVFATTTSTATTAPQIATAAGALLTALTTTDDTAVDLAAIAARLATISE